MKYKLTMSIYTKILKIINEDVTYDFQLETVKITKNFCIFG